MFELCNNVVSIFLISDESVKWFEMWTEWNLKILLHLDLCTLVHRSKSGITINYSNILYGIMFSINIFGAQCYV